MTRAPQQILVLPFTADEAGRVRYAVLHRADMDAWQGVAGGVEDEESPLQAARRECIEELGTDRFDLIALASVSTIPASNFAAWPQWRRSDPDLLVVPERCFGARLRDRSDVRLSREHVEVAWLTYDEALARLTWDSNRNALWELHERLTGPSVWPPPATNPATATHRGPDA